MSMGLTARFISSFQNTGFIQLARKSADETINNDSTLNDDVDLVLAVKANSFYIIDAWIVYNSAAAADIKMTFKALAAATASWGFSYDQSPTEKGLGDVAAVPTDATDQWMWIHGSLATGATAGNLQFQWAQNASDAGNTILRAESYIAITRVE
jgi:hypothetical protein